MAARAWLVAALLPAAAVTPAREPDPAAATQPPQVIFEDLFVAAQMQPIFADSKSFADAVPLDRPAAILALYHAAPPATAQSLARFIDAHFVLPVPPPTPTPTPTPGGTDIVSHIDRLWNRLTRRTTQVPPYSSLLPLPAPYVVPGGRFREVYYWDSYFTMLGLLESGRPDLVAGMIRDFAHLIDAYGHIPNGARTYYLSRSQPPFFFEMVALLTHDDPAAGFARYLPQLEREYAFWMDGERGLAPGKAHRRVVAMADGSILNRYWDDRDTPRDESYREDRELSAGSRRAPPQLFRDIRAAAESGWDFSSRWFDDGRTRATLDTTEIVPIDLNSLLFGLENAIRLGCRRRADPACEKRFEARAAARRSAIDRYLWDRSRGAYLDYRWTRRAPAVRPSAATLYPLFVSLASADQAAAVSRTAAQDLLAAGGIVTTTVDSGEQWDSPNGWAPLQWIAIAGLRDYHQSRLAEAIACRWMRNVDQLYRRSGKLVEKYDVIHVGHGGGGGEYPTQDGFGWTNGVMRKLIALYPAEFRRAATAPCPLP